MNLYQGKILENEFERKISKAEIGKRVLCNIMKEWKKNLQHDRVCHFKNILGAEQSGSTNKIKSPNIVLILPVPRASGGANQSN